MNMIDYVALLLINMAAGMFMLACYVVKGRENGERWAPALAVPGLVALLSGLHMCWTWPLPGPYNSAFGEMSVLLGILFLGLAWALARGWRPAATAVYGFFAGLAAIVVGVRIFNLRGTPLQMTAAPLLSSVGFIVSGLAGVLLPFTLRWRENVALRVILAVVLILAAGLWTFVACGAYWAHMDTFTNWKPATMAKP